MTFKERFQRNYNFLYKDKMIIMRFIESAITAIMPSAIYGIVHEHREIKRKLDTIKRTDKIIENINNNDKNMTIKIVFIISYYTNWSSRCSVYEAATNHEGVEAIVLWLPKDRGGCWEYDVDSQDENFRIRFETQNSGFYYAYDSFEDRWFDLKNFRPDYVIYDEPYNSAKYYIYNSHEVKEYAKVCLIPYTFILSDSPVLLHTVLPDDFLATMYCIFAPWDLVSEYCRNFNIKYKCKNRKIAQLGYPRFDLYKVYRNQERCTVMWTPRWTTPSKDLSGYNNGFSDDPSFKTSFFKFKDAIIDRCQSFDDEMWIVRPHPSAFRNYINRGVMTEEQVEEYKALLYKLENIKLDEQIDIWDSFAAIDIFLTDFSTIIAEMFITGKPIIYCGNPKALPEGIIKNNLYYAEEFDKVQQIILDLKNGVDPLQQSREEAAKILRGSNISNNIGMSVVNYLYNDYHLLN